MDHRNTYFAVTLVLLEGCWSAGVDDDSGRSSTDVQQSGGTVGATGGLDDLSDECTTDDRPARCQPERLKALSLSAGTLEPAFDPEIHSYSVQVDWLVGELSIAYETSDSAEVSLQPYKPTANDGSFAVPLNLDQNTISIEVRAANQEPVQYHLNITRGTTSATVLGSEGSSTTYFGQSVALSGNVLAVGARGDRTIAYGAGAVYLYERDASTGWHQVAVLHEPDPAGGQQFGSSLALQGDTLAVGAESADVGDSVNAGAVHIFVRSDNGTWNHSEVLTAPNVDASDAFGHSIALDGNTLAISADRESSSTRNLETDNNDLDEAGAVYIYTRSNAGWALSSYVKAPIPQLRGQFGYALAMADGRLAVTAIGDNSPLQIDDDPNNYRLGPGSLYLFELQEDESWTTSLHVQEYDSAVLFGTSVDLSSDTLVVGVSKQRAIATDLHTQEGAVRVYQRSAQGDWELQTELVAAENSGAYSFGADVALGTSSLLVGAIYASPSPSSNDEAPLPGPGAVYFFDRHSSGNWAASGYWASPTDGTPWYGKGLALDGQTWVVGAAGDHEAVYAY